jgi:acetoin:2,6-dichlorophenolindophenol oxidoreductase subunit alpha
MLDRIFRKMCEIRYFEKGLIKAHKQGLISCPVYLSTGQEAVAATISEIYQPYKIFPQHRCHSIYLSYGGDPIKLRDEILGLSTGCAGGKGGSSDAQSDVMEAHHGFIGENVSIATGYALGSGNKTMAFFGDGALEEDYVSTSFGFAAKHNLPILFVVEDNDLAILTKIEERRNWDTIHMAKGFGLGANMCEDNPEDIVKAIYGVKLPYVINIKTCRHYWHVGIGQDGTPDRDRLSMLRPKIKKATEIEKEAMLKMEEVWKL